MTVFIATPRARATVDAALPTPSPPPPFLPSIPLSSVFTVPSTTPSTASLPQTLDRARALGRLARAANDLLGARYPLVVARATPACMEYPLVLRPRGAGVAIRAMDVPALLTWLDVVNPAARALHASRRAVRVRGGGHGHDHGGRGLRGGARGHMRALPLRADWRRGGVERRAHAVQRCRRGWSPLLAWRHARSWLAPCT